MYPSFPSFTNIFYQQHLMIVDSADILPISFEEKMSKIITTNIPRNLVNFFWYVKVEVLLSNM